MFQNEKEIFWHVSWFYLYIVFISSHYFFLDTLRFSRAPWLKWAVVLHVEVEVVAWWVDPHLTIEWIGLEEEVAVELVWEEEWVDTEAEEEETWKVYILWLWRLPYTLIILLLYCYYTVILLLYCYYTLIILLSYCYLFIIEWPLPITRVYFFKISKKRHISSVLLEGWNLPSTLNCAVYIER